jgi:hypothetical protein
MAKSVSKAQLVKAVEELNDVLGLDPQIDVTLEEDVLVRDLLDAAELLVPEDDISEATINVINDLNELQEAGDEVAADEDDAEAPVDAEEETPAEEPEKEEVPAEPAKKGPQPKGKKMTRPEALAKALVVQGDEEFTDKEIVSTSRKVYEAANRLREDSDRGAEAEWVVTRRILIAFDILKVNNDNKVRTYKYVGPRTLNI